MFPVFEEYRAQLAGRGLKEVDDAYRDAAALLRDDDPGSGYAAVVVARRAQGPALRGSWKMK